MPLWRGAQPDVPCTSGDWLALA